jgi:protein-glutamine gamma-glutamyltransferase
MAQQAFQSGIIPVHKAIDKYFELSLYLLVVTGFVTLAGTGGLDLPSVALVGIALAVRGYLLAKRRQFVISERWTTPLSIAYFAFFAIDYLVFSRAFLPATIHLALFGVVIRMFSVRRERDHLMLAILAFLMVLAAAVLTVDSVFLFCFAAFMLMSVATFVLLEMRRSGHAANIHARHSSDAHEHRHLAFALLRFAPVLMVMILLCGALLFFVMPRMSAGYLGGYTFGTDFASGFSDHVELGKIGQIQQSNAVVMHIQIDGDQTGHYELHWRGVALAKFDGQSWSNPREPFLLRHRGDGSFAVPGPDIAWQTSVTPASEHGTFIHYRVLMEPIGTNVFFLAPWPRSVNGEYAMLAADAGGAVYNFDSRHSLSRYEAVSDIASPSGAQLRSAGSTYPPVITATYLRLPLIDARIPPLAAQITRSAKTDYDKAAQIEQYLRTNFGYTLQLPQTQVKDPIGNFLFERKQGHCEYFASSMAVMLRSLGIPSRVVTGFRSDEFNDITESYVVRAKDAHAWVEAYFPGFGWQMFDPTPAGTASGTRHGWARLALYVDAMSSFWREWIVSYDASHQFTLGQAAVTGSRNLWTDSRKWARHKYASMLRWARQKQDRVEHSPARWALAGLAIALILALLANMGRILRAVQEKWVSAHPERAPEQAASIWYERMTRMLSRKGMRRSKGQTAQEFVRRIENQRLREPVARFTSVYESARFGNSPGDASRLPELYEEVQEATRDR